MLTKNYKYRYLPYIKILKQKIKFLERKKIKQNKSIHVTMFKGFLKNVPDYSFLKKTTCLIRICNTRKKKSLLNSITEVSFPALSLLNYSEERLLKLWNEVKKRYVC